MIEPQPSRATSAYTYFQRGNPADAQPPTQAGFALMGGGQDVDDAFRWLVERGGRGDVLVLRGSGADGYQEYLDQLCQPDSVETLVLHQREAAHDPFVLERVAQADAIFLAGGDQWNYVGKWSQTPLLEALQQAVLRGVPLGGTSAGLAVLGQHVFTAERGTITSEEALADPYQERMTLESSFLDAPALEGLVTDSHFSERDRLGRLAAFMARQQTDLRLPSIDGVGVDEGTAALLEPDGRSRVVGAGGVHWLRAESEAPEVCAPGQPLSYGPLSLVSVRQGQSFDRTLWSSPEVEPSTLHIRQGRLEP